MRTVAYHFEDLDAFEETLAAHEQELEVPDGEAVAEGEWVLAMFEVGAKRRATAAAARGLDRGDGTMVLAFERRDWERLQGFATSIEKMVAAQKRPPSEVPLHIEEDLVMPDAAAFAATEPLDAPSAPNASAVMPSAAALSTAELRAAPVVASGGSGGPADDDVAPTLVQDRASLPKVDAPRPSGGFARTSAARVLVVDDDPDIREVVGTMLETVGLAVETVESAEAALERVARSPFDLVVLDWNLPGMTGIDLCRQLRREPRFTGLPVLFLTAHGSSKDVVEAFASGADDYVTKPFRAPELGARIFGLLRRARHATSPAAV